MPRNKPEIQITSVHAHDPICSDVIPKLARQYTSRFPFYRHRVEAQLKIINYTTASARTLMHTLHKGHVMEHCAGGKTPKEYKGGALRLFHGIEHLVLHLLEPELAINQQDASGMTFPHDSKARTRSNILVTASEAFYADERLVTEKRLQSGIHEAVERVNTFFRDISASSSTRPVRHPKFKR